MALEISIYNRQKQTSASGKEYTSYALAFVPGQRGALVAAAELPPFYVRDQRGGKQWIRLEARTLQEAKTEAAQQQHVLQARANGVDVVSASGDSTERLTSKVDAYLAEIEANRARKSWLAYKNTLENFFLKSCHKLRLAEINRQDILAFKTFLKNKEIADRSIYNHFLNVMIFLKWAGHKVDISKKKGDWPDKAERVVEAYTNEELEKLFRAADHDERLLLKALLFSGFREGEIAHLTYRDIDATNSLWKVQKKKDWEPKTKASQRQVPVPEPLTNNIMERMRKGKRQLDDLVFPQKLHPDKADGHLLKIVKRVAKRAKFTDIRVDQHKFRATYITLQLLNPKNPQLDVTKWVGHKDTKMLSRYYEAANLRNKDTFARATESFNGFIKSGD
jgi:integrase